MTEPDADRSLGNNPTVLLAWRNLVRNPLRSFLAGLGILIGVLAIAALGMFGTTLELAADRFLGGIGQMIVIRPAFDAGVRSLTPADVAGIRGAAPGSTVVPIMAQRQFVYHQDNKQFVTVYGIDRPGEIYTVSSGEIPRDFERSEGIVVGSGVAETNDIQVQDTVNVKGREYRVVAILESEGTFSPVSPNQAVILPQREMGAENFTHVVVQTPPEKSPSAVATAIKEVLNEEEKRVTTSTYSDVTTRIADFFRVLDIFLVSVGLVSMVVAGVSILNVMLMSTVERREEIGVLRAIGFQRSSVMYMILLEAVLLGVISGVLGTFLSMGLGVALNQIALGDPMATFRTDNLLFPAIALVFGIGTSVVSGLYPAWRGARQNPVEALRG